MEDRGLPLAADLAVLEDERERRERERHTARRHLKAQRQAPANSKITSDAVQFYRNDRKACPDLWHYQHQPITMHACLSN